MTPVPSTAPGGTFRETGTCRRSVASIDVHLPVRQVVVVGAA